jgi:hypothetical protein
MAAVVVGHKARFSMSSKNLLQAQLGKHDSDMLPREGEDLQTQ